MAVAIKKCRVCGKEYEACRSLKRGVPGTLRWQEIACSPECGARYFAMILESRSIDADSANTPAVEATFRLSGVSEDDPEDDEEEYDADEDDE